MSDLTPDDRLAARLIALDDLVESMLDDPEYLVTFLAEVRDSSAIKAAGVALFGAMEKNAALAYELKCAARGEAVKRLSQTELGSELENQ